jgi:hypothetical protein
MCPSIHVDGEILPISSIVALLLKGQALNKRRDRPLLVPFKQNRCEGSFEPNGAFLSRDNAMTLLKRSLKRLYV